MVWIRLIFFVTAVFQVMFESGYLTLFGKDLGEDKRQAQQAAQKALVLNALENFKEFDKIFPALVAGLPIHVFKSAYSAREVSGFFPQLSKEPMTNCLDLMPQCLCAAILF